MMIRLWRVSKLTNVKISPSPVSSQKLEPEIIEYGFYNIQRKVRSATRAELEAAIEIKTKMLMMAGRAMSIRFQMCLSHMSLEFVLPTERFVALRLWTFERAWRDMGGFDVPPQTCLSSEGSGVSASSPSTFVLARSVRSITQSE